MCGGIEEAEPDVAELELGSLRHLCHQQFAGHVVLNVRAKGCRDPNRDETLGNPSNKPT